MIDISGRSEWPRGLRRGSTAARLLRLHVRIPPGAWMSVLHVLCVWSDRGLCVGLVIRPEGVLSSVACLSVVVKPRQ
jgi:hypothetical protein